MKYLDIVLFVAILILSLCVLIFEIIGGFNQTTQDIGFIKIFTQNTDEVILVLISTLALYISSRLYKLNQIHIQIKDINSTLEYIDLKK